MAKAEYRSALRSRKLIHQAFAELMQEKSLDKITVTDIVKRADINRGTFYAHYSDISSMVHHYVADSFLQIQEALEAGSYELEEIPAIIVREIQRILEDDMEFFRKLMNSSISLSLQDELGGIMQEYLLTKESVSANFSRKDYVLILRFCVGGLGNLYRDWFAGRFDCTLAQLTERAEKILSSIIIGGLVL
ncbi:MAG: TetR family transcriptional regulator [Clostridiales bacterium]|nr:TetR family transcriptional regulator [Clostridiales bacterium]